MVCPQDSGLGSILFNLYINCISDLNVGGRVGISSIMPH